MKTFSSSFATIGALLLSSCAVNAFQPAYSNIGGIGTKITSRETTPTTTTSLHGYIPDGFTKESYAKFQKAEAAKKAKKNLGRVGPKGFKSRSFQSFQEALERGEAEHLLPVMNAKERVKKGELRKEDIPYMQRGGAWDNSDVRGAKRAKWLKSDKDYASGGFKKEQSVSIFGVGEGLDWTGSKGRTGPYGGGGGGNKKQAQGKKNKKGGDDEPKKKLFGLF
mmetsp:Transcript_13846/g.17468  ORF Transcript_13846/g.17468 Transcript_13846/m.17468 type:complete len:222 (+) Transcript_13846:235-900(+)